MLDNFNFSRTPELYFGAGSFSGLPGIINRFGKKALVVTGGSSFKESGRMDILSGAFKELSINAEFLTVKREPTPEIVDETVSQFRTAGIDVICSIGGGSVVDAGKAVSAMYLQDGSVFDYLEGVGTGKKHNGRKIPFIAVPTTAGTGSEATKNAVLSRVGSGGFKKSLRHENLVPDVAVIDPGLALSCPRDVTAYSGMDAFTQLLESYVSTKSNALTDALCESGLLYIINNLAHACSTGSGDAAIRSAMSYAAYLSGIALANAGLGTVHGFASSVGSLYDIPHGVVCGTLLGETVKTTIKKLQEEDSAENNALIKYAKIGSYFAGNSGGDTEYLCNLLIENIMNWTEELEIPLLSWFGVSSMDFDNIIENTSNKNNPVELDENDLKQILGSRIE
ncbi:iron-containing alcohol dehydrogenase [candidate division KSB1 bacterium]